MSAGQVSIFNASATVIFVSVNGGTYLQVPAVASTSWNPAQPESEPAFSNNQNPSPGSLGFGKNTLTMYPESGGPASTASFTLTVPFDVIVSALQLYLFWKSANSVAWIALNSGQPFQISFISDNPANLSANIMMSEPTARAAPVRVQVLM